MKAGSVLVNVSRGEIVDEDALTDALQRDHLRGAALDVYDGEFERAPIPRLWSDSKVLITPHISAASDSGSSRRHRPVLRQSARLSRWRAAPKRRRLGTGLLAALQIAGDP